MKKKYLLALLILVFVVTGCNGMMNTPTKRTEEYLGKFQTHDKEVISELQDVINKDTALKNDDHRKKYGDLMKKQYQNLSYKIKDETVNGDSATVTVEIEVFDYYTAMDKATRYISEHQEEFQKEDKTLDDIKVMTYKLEQMEKSKDKVKYTIEFHLTKKDDKWTLNDIPNATLQKIQGMYQV